MPDMFRDKDAPTIFGTAKILNGENGYGFVASCAVAILGLGSRL